MTMADSLSTRRARRGQQVVGAGSEADDGEPPARLETADGDGRLRALGLLDDQRGAVGQHGGLRHARRADRARGMIAGIGHLEAGEQRGGIGDEIHPLARRPEQSGPARSVLASTLVSAQMDDWDKPRSANVAASSVRRSSTEVPRLQPIPTTSDLGCSTTVGRSVGTNTASLTRMRAWGSGGGGSTLTCVPRRSTRSTPGSVTLLGSAGSGHGCSRTSATGRPSITHRFPGEITGGLPAQRVQTGQPQRVGRGGEHRGGTPDPPRSAGPVRSRRRHVHRPGDDESSGLVDHDHAGIGLLVGE